MYPCHAPGSACGMLKFKTSRKHPGTVLSLNCIISFEPECWRKAGLTSRARFSGHLSHPFFVFLQFVSSTDEVQTGRIRADPVYYARSLCHIIRQRSLSCCVSLLLCLCVVVTLKPFRPLLASHHGRFLLSRAASRKRAYSRREIPSIH